MNIHIRENTVNYQLIIRGKIIIKPLSCGSVFFLLITSIAGKQDKQVKIGIEENFFHNISN